MELNEKQIILTIWANLKYWIINQKHAAAICVISV